ncbi:MAG: dual OB domain-containing protein [Chloroflexota bacterium]|nr:hypothetical protein [Chloroflexota bacterium]MBI5701959.1 hypothetical protein [Chloroflexota bacterium]
MKALIVAKTRMQNAACIGGILENNRSVRLLQPNGHNHPQDTDYQVGQVWEIEFQERQDIIPPHVEDILVQRRRLLGTYEHLGKYLRARVKIWKGGIENLYDGFIRFTQNGSGYICHKIGLPSVSTGYWLPDKPLALVYDSNQPNKVRYKYAVTGYDKYVSYVGYEEPLPTIPANTLIRVSLARWWKPDDAPEMEERCYLQLSGWYLK